MERKQISKDRAQEIQEKLEQGVREISDYSFGYISGWSRDKEVTELKENLDLIKKNCRRHYG